METFIQALSLALAMEGIGFALFPGAMSRTLAEMSRLPLQSLRVMGAAALALSVLLASLLKALR